MPDEILCCPFCGRPAVIESGSHDVMPGVGCGACHYLIQRETVQEVLAVWNRRAIPVESPANGEQQANGETISLCIGCVKENCSQRSEIKCCPVIVCAMRQAK
jgi:hypothetical protein